MPRRGGRWIMLRRGGRFDETRTGTHLRHELRPSTSPFLRVLLRAAVIAALLPFLLCIGILVQVSPSAAQPTSWSITPSPNTAASETNELRGLSCTSPSFCVAVGDARSGTGGTYQTLVETSNGTNWSITPSPNTDASQLNDLQAVSCTSPSFCVAVGEAQGGTGGTLQTLVETFNGTSWSITPSPNAGTLGSSLLGVSCTSQSSCVAVGSSTSGVPESEALTHTLIETFNGTSWSIRPSPNRGTGNQLFGVSCTNPSFCVAVGEAKSGTGGTLQTLVEAFNGTSWSITPSPNRGAGNQLLGVSCKSQSSCIAVGRAASGTNGILQTLVETFNGTSWSITPSPNTGTLGSSLLGVSCTSQSSCVAVGFSASGVPGSEALTHTLVETFNGLGWSITTSPGAAASQHQLKAVSCIPQSSCVAVGFVQSRLGAALQTLIETGASTTAPLPQSVVGVEGGNSALYVRKAGATSFTNLGGVLTGAPAIAGVPVSGGSPVPLYVVTGGNHSLYVRSDTRGFQRLTSSGTCLDNPAAVVTGTAGNATLTVACQGENHALYTIQGPVSAGSLPRLSGWRNLGGVLTAGPAVAPIGGTPTFFVTGGEGRVYTRTPSATRFTATPWTCIGHPAAATSGSATTFACHGGGNALWYSINKGTGWSPGTSAGGTVVDGPGVAATSKGAVFYIEAGDAAIWQNFLPNGGSLGGWQRLGGVARQGAGAAGLG